MKSNSAVFHGGYGKIRGKKADFYRGGVNRKKNGRKTSGNSSETLIKLTAILIGPTVIIYTTSTWGVQKVNIRNVTSGTL